MALEDVAISDASLLSQLKHAFAKNITFSKKLVVSGIISYSADGCSERFVKVNFSLEGDSDLSETNSVNKPIPCDTHSKIKQLDYSCVSPPILPSIVDRSVPKSQSCGQKCNERRGRRKLSKPRRQPLMVDDRSSTLDVTPNDMSADEKQDQECAPAKKIKTEEIDDVKVGETALTAPSSANSNTDLQALLSIVGAGFKVDSQKVASIDSSNLNSPCGISTFDPSLLQKLIANGQVAIPFPDMLKQSLQTPVDPNDAGIFTAICETPGFHTKNFVISRSMAAAFGNSFSSGNNASADGTISKADDNANSEQNDVKASTSVNDAAAQITNGDINFLQCNVPSQAAGTPISIGLPVTSNASFHPTLTVIGNLQNSVSSGAPTTILSIGNANNRNISVTNNASAVTAILRGLSRAKPQATNSVLDAKSETPVSVSNVEQKTIPGAQSSPKVPLDINYLAAAVAALTGSFPRNPTISPGPLPGSFLLSCPKIVPSNEQNSQLLNTSSQKLSEAPLLTTNIGDVTAERVKSKEVSKGSSDSTIDRILENIRGQLRASEAEKSAKTSLVTSNCLRKMKANELKPSNLISQCGGGIRIQLPIKKSTGKLAPVAPSPMPRPVTNAQAHTSTTPASSTGESMHKVYKCRYCLKTFNRKFCRERHERLHTGVKPYKCDVCNEKFIRLEDKKRHIRSILHTSKVAAAQASGKLIPASLDPQSMSEGDASPTSEHNFPVEDSAADAQGGTETPEDQTSISESPSPPTQASFKHSRRSELKQAVTPVRLSSSDCSKAT